MQADGAEIIGKSRRRTATIGLALLVAYPLSIGPVYRIVHPTGRPSSLHRQYWGPRRPGCLPAAGLRLLQVVGGRKHYVPISRLVG